MKENSSIWKFLTTGMNDAIDASKAASTVIIAVSEGELTPKKEHVSRGLSIATDARWS